MRAAPTLCGGGGGGGGRPALPRQAAMRGLRHAPMRLRSGSVDSDLAQTVRRRAPRALYLCVLQANPWLGKRGRGRTIGDSDNVRKLNGSCSSAERRFARRGTGRRDHPVFADQPTARELVPLPRGNEPVQAAAACRCDESPLSAPELFHRELHGRRDRELHVDRVRNSAHDRRLSGLSVDRQRRSRTGTRAPTTSGSWSTTPPRVTLGTG
jgi:hypothetical protein